MARRIAKVMVTKRTGAGLHSAPDELIVEEPLEVRLDGNLVTTTMRTPGHDFELAAGLCLGDGLLSGAAIRTVAYCATGSAISSAFNVVTVDTGSLAPPAPERLRPTTSSCGLCGSTSIEQLVERLSPVVPQATFDLDVLVALPERMGTEQALFARTGSVHAAAAFTDKGQPLVMREDVGRHNAVDKVVGRLLLDGRLPADRLGLYVSGRASFEIVQKAWAAGFAAVVAVSAPTALAVETARTGGIMLAGFVRGERMTLYSPAP
ncbi:MAG: formate dehydrogenase accessory sulfurtransferase FdhD [Actinomycetota bacterium]|nr:formate dehydrogenase accessory sulfurtransferase FdhD [Actinomycetota bacterium]